MEKRRLGLPELAGLAVTALGIALLLGGGSARAAALIPIAVSVLSGACCVCTRQVTAQLSERAGLLTGTWFSYFTGSLVAVAAVIISPALGAGADFSLAFAAPCWAYLGGALGAAAVYLQNLCVKRMSSVAMTLVMFAGQVFGGAAIDRRVLRRILRAHPRRRRARLRGARPQRPRREARHTPNLTSGSFARRASIAASAYSHLSSSRRRAPRRRGRTPARRCRNGRRRRSGAPRTAASAYTPGRTRRRAGPCCAGPRGRKRPARPRGRAPA